MKTTLFFLLFLSVAFGQTEKIKRFDTISDEGRQYIIRALVREIEDSEILIFHLRKDEFDRKDSVMDGEIYITLGCFAARVCCFLKGEMTVKPYDVGYLYEGDLFRGGIWVATSHSGFPPAYNSFLRHDNLVRLIFVKRQRTPLKDCLKGGRTFFPALCKEVETLSGEAFIQKYGLESIFSNRVFRTLEGCVFHVDYSVPELPVTKMMVMNNSVYGSKASSRTLAWSGLIHLSPEEISEIVYIAYRMDKKSGGHKAYMEACAREPKVLLPMDEKKPVFKTTIGIALRDALRKKAEDEKQKAAKAAAKLNPPPTNIVQRVEPQKPRKKTAHQLRIEQMQKRIALLGDGYPGALLLYPESPELRGQMSKYGLTAGYFQRSEQEDGIRQSFSRMFPTNSLPYLLYSPKPSREPVPLVVYFGGNGEHGTNLVDQFRQPLVFEKVTSPEFQRRHPCYLFAPMLPKDSTFGGTTQGGPNPLSKLTCDALYEVIRSLNNPPVDTNRLYVTGLSYGGMATHRLLWLYPGRFAAGVPAEYMVVALKVPTPAPNCWFLCNEGGDEFREMRKKNAADNIKNVREAGGDCRVSFYPSSSHDAWKKAWLEDSVWDWMFSKTADGRPVPRRAGLSPALVAAAPELLPEGRFCTASVPGKDAAHGPEYGADGLDNTCYMSAAPVKTGDWWMVDFSAPVTGTIVLHSGTPSGEGILKLGRVETSANGTVWTRAGTFSAKTGSCRIRLTAPIRYLRVLPENRNPEILTLRNLILTP